MAQSKELTIEEKNIILPVLLKALKKSTYLNPIHAPKLVDWFNYKKGVGPLTKMKSNFSEQRLRKLVNYIRNNGILPVISGPTGYYVSTDPSEIISMAKSMEDRADSIRAAAKGLRNLATEIKNEVDDLGFNWG